MQKQQKFIQAIMACDPNGVIGNLGKIPWRYQEDIDFFQQFTKEGTMVMGYNTFLSMPESLINRRQCIVFSRNHIVDKKYTNIKLVRSLEEFNSIDQIGDYFMIGGGEIANLFLSNNMVDEFLLTKIKKSYKGDCFFSLHLLENWKRVLIKETPDFAIYRCYV